MIVLGASVPDPPGSSPYRDKYGALYGLERGNTGCKIPHSYSDPQHLGGTLRYSIGADSQFSSHRTGAMHDPASELRRISLPRTPVNKLPLLLDTRLNHSM